MTLRDRVRNACAAKPTRVYVVVGLAVAAWAMVAIPAQATYGALTTADEPQYLLSALSLAEDRNLRIDDELREGRYRAFHEVDLPRQAQPRADGAAVSPHDPLLPTILAVPMGLGGWVAAKATLAVLAGVLAGLLTWMAHRRLGVALGVAALCAVTFGVTAPLAPYATQLYPELPAALALAVGIAALTAPSPLRRGAVALLVLAAIALPWLSVKYTPVAAALATVGLVRLWRDDRTRALVAAATSWGLAAAGYLLAHRLIYGGWTAYAAGDHFVGGEFTVVGSDPNYLGRSRRLVGLLLDGGFGLAAWMPGYLLAVPALAAVMRRRPAGWGALVFPLAVGWASATWVALTMHGWWWPGRQVVIVLPCLVLAVAWWVGQRPRGRLTALLLGGVVGAVTWLWLVVEVLRQRRTLIVDFETTSNPLYRGLRAVLPDYRNPGLDDWLLQAAWLVVLGAAGAGSAIAARRAAHIRVANETRRPINVPAQRTSAHVPA